MKRKIIEIDQDKCIGCGACADACHEGAIVMRDGKAYLLRDDYCDGLGDCLPACPTDAITITEREADEYDPKAVEASKAIPKTLACGCPGTQVRSIEHSNSANNSCSSNACSGETCNCGSSELSNWPVQIKLAPVVAPFFDKAHLLIAADCTAFALGNFHDKFIKGRITLIGCPKLDSVDYSEKIEAIIRKNDILDVTIVRMEVPCCGGLEYAVKEALQRSGKFIPWQVVTISSDGRIL